MCTGPRASHCPAEQLAWQVYDEHGYRPRALRPCLTTPGPGPVDRPGRERAGRQRLFLVLARVVRRATRRAHRAA